jgi:hypothetical protein
LRTTELRSRSTPGFLDTIRNNGDGTFTDVTKQAGLSDDSKWATGAAFGDYDGDGWDDLFVAPLDDSAMKTSFDYFDDKAKHHLYFGRMVFPVAPARAIILSSNSLEIPQTLIAFFCATCSPPQAGKRYIRSKPQT